MASYNISQEWKNPKKRNRNIVITIAVLLLIWWFCGFGGSKPWAIDLNHQLGTYACPGQCWINGSGGGPFGGGNNNNPGTPGDTGTTCPPLNTKFEALDQTLYAQSGLTCLNQGGTWTHSGYEVSCRDTKYPIDCEALRSNADNIKFMNGCHAFGGVYHCQDNWVGCYCPGSGPIPYGNAVQCSRTIDWIYNQASYNCEGICPISGTCQEVRGSCTCAVEETGDCSFQERLGRCGGQCDIPGMTCQPFGNIDCRCGYTYLT